MYIFTSKIGFILQVFEYNPPGDTHIRPDSWRIIRNST
jgi:hypothetical protein